MSREINNLGRHRIVEFYGGDKRGSMLQITTQNVSFPDGELTVDNVIANMEGFIQLTKQEAIKLNVAIDNWLLNK